MPHMMPEYTSEPFLTGENHHGESDASPFEVWCNLRDNDRAYAAKHDLDVQRKAIERFAADRKLVASTVEVVIGKWWARLSAPGYMDCTDWDGPHDTEQAARDAIQRAYDVNPTTGEDDDEQDDEHP